MPIKPNQQLEAVSISIKPITESPISIDFFNGESYVGTDGVTYPGYSSVVIGTISKNEEDETYISEQDFAKMAIDAYYDIDAYVNKALSVLGMYNTYPNFTAIPVITRDHIDRAIAAKIEQNLFTGRSGNAEIKFTLTQNSGGRTTNIPGRENFNPTDLLNQKVQLYINGSNVFEILADSFEAIVLDRNEYYTKDEINAIISSGQVPIDVIYTPADWVPENDGDAVNKLYVDQNDADLQAQINALITGDIELHTEHVVLYNQQAESLSGFATHQSGVNIENKAAISLARGRLDNLAERVGIPFSGIKSTSQSVTNTLTQIINYETSDLGTVDETGTFDAANGTYTIDNVTVGDIVSFEVQGKVTGRPQPAFIAGSAVILVNGIEMIDPNTGLPVTTDFTIKTVAGTTFSLKTSNIAIRPLGTEGDNEISEGDIISLAVIQSNTNAALGNPLLVSDVQFEMVYKRTASADVARSAIDDITDAIQNLADKTTNDVTVSDASLESLSGTAVVQADINREFVLQFNSLVDSVLPIGTIQLGTSAPTFGTWELVGALAEGQTIVGGADTNGELISHDHYMFENTTINVSSAESLTSAPDNTPGASFLITGDNSYQMKTTFGTADAGLTSTTGGTQNKAYGLGLGTINVYRRTA